MILLIVAGANGSGKTTFAKEFIKEFKAYIYLNADEIKFNEKISEIEAGKRFLKRLKKAIKEKKNILIETTLSGKYVFKIIENSKRYGYKVKLIYIYLDSEIENVLRVKKRVLLGGHDVDSEDIIRRYKRSLENFDKIKNRVDEWELYFNGENNFELVATNLEVIDEDRFSKFKNR